MSNRRGALLAALATHEPADAREDDSLRRTLALERDLLLAPAGTVPDPPEDESQDVEWFGIAEAAELSDPSVAAALRRLNDRHVGGS